MKEDEGTPRQRKYELGKVVSEILPLSPAPLLILQADSKTAVVNPRANLDPTHLGASKLELCTEKGILCEPQGSESLSQCQLCLPPPIRFSPVPFPLHLMSMTPSLYPHLSLRSLSFVCLPHWRLCFPPLSSLYPFLIFNLFSSSFDPPSITLYLLVTKSCS